MEIYVHSKIKKSESQLLRLKIIIYFPHSKEEDSVTTICGFCDLMIYSPPHFYFFSSSKI